MGTKPAARLRREEMVGELVSKEHEIDELDLQPTLTSG